MSIPRKQKTIVGRTGTKTTTKLSVGIKSNSFLHEGKVYLFVTGRTGYYLLSPDGIYYLLKEVRGFHNWRIGKLKILLSSNGGRMLMHESERTECIGTIYPIENGFLYVDWVTKEQKNIYI